MFRSERFALLIVLSFFHGSAHSRVLRNLICVPPGTKPISEVLRGELSKVDLRVTQELPLTKRIATKHKPLLI